jgi:hypothetical protein
LTYNETVQAASGHRRWWWIAGGIAGLVCVALTVWAFRAPAGRDKVLPGVLAAITFLVAAVGAFSPIWLDILANRRRRKEQIAKDFLDFRIAATQYGQARRQLAQTDQLARKAIVQLRELEDAGPGVNPGELQAASTSAETLNAAHKASAEALGPLNTTLIAATETAKSARPGVVQLAKRLRDPQEVMGEAELIAELGRLNPAKRK